MPDNKEQDNQKMTPDAERQGGSSMKPPYRLIFIWLVLIFLVPMLFWIFNHGGGVPLKELSQSDLEELLEKKLVKTVKVVDESRDKTMLLEGTYWPSEQARLTWESRYAEKLVPNGKAADKKGASAVAVKGKTGKKDGKSLHEEPLVYRFKTRVVYNDYLDSQLRYQCENRETEVATGLWTSLLVSALPLLLLVGLFYFMMSRQIRGASNSAMMFGKSRARKLNMGRDKVTLKDVAGCEEAKEDMQEIVDFLKDPVSFRRLGGKIPRGVLMSGPPGTGKTLLAKAIAGEADVPFFSISGSDFVEMFVGVGASRVRDMFEEGKKNAPCIIFIDEIDAVGRSRFSGIGGGHDEREQTLNALLVEMDGFEANSGVIVMAATNRPDVLDPALTRPGRFDRQIFIGLPDLRGRLEILKIHAKKVLMDPSVDLRVIARGTTGFSGADLANLINEAALLATRLKKNAVGLSELEEARDRVCWGKERRSHKVTEEDKKLTAYHEGGHALVNILCKHTEPLHKITIIPRGQAGGMTMFLPEQDQSFMTYQEMRDMIAVGLGGRAAETLTMDDISTGASADIRHVTEIAKSMVCKYGMSQKMGPVNYIGREEHIFLGRDITRSEDFSPETAREIDLEIRRLVEEGKDRAETLLKENLDKLKILAEALLEKETLTAAEVYELLGMEMPEPKGIEEDFEDEQPKGAEASSAPEMAPLTADEAMRMKDGNPSENASAEKDASASSDEEKS